MSSSLWSINSDKSSGSLSWEDESDDISQNYLQNMFETIDRIVFSDQQIPEDFPIDLAEECQLWRQKFGKKFEKINSRNIERKPSKLKSLSASETEQINVNCGTTTRSLSERRSSKTRFDSIPNKLNNRKDVLNGRERQMKVNQKPLILPPLVNVSHIKRNQSQTYKPNNISKIPNITQMRTSFPKPAPVLSLEHLLKEPNSSLIEENGTKYPIVLNSNYGKSQHKATEMSRPTVLPLIHK